MHLLVDIGNRNLKWRCGSQAGGFLSNPETLCQSLNNYWRDLQKVDCVCLVNVAGNEVDKIITDWTSENWGILPNFVKSEQQAHGVTNGYLDYRQLGADRWVCLIGARQLGELPAIVVDCGTAITVDALNDQGHFIGGSIIPGFSLAQSTLSINARGISEPPRDEITMPARTTSEAISGTIVATAAGVDELVSRYRKIVGENAGVLLTGGEATLLSANSRLELQHFPDLAFIGLEFFCNHQCQGSYIPK